MITKNSKTVLVADDSVFFRTKLSDILVEAGHRVRFAGDGRDVIKEVKIDSGGIDLLILDLQMPDIDGFGVLKWLRDNGHAGKFPVLVVTGVYEPGNVIEKLKEFGAAGLMTKGFTPEHIIFRVHRILFPEKNAARPRGRVPVSLAVDFRIGEITRTGFLLNLSETGAYLHTKAELLTGAVLHLKFTLPGADRLLDLKGVIVWSTDEKGSKALFGGYGVKFDSVEKEDQELLGRFVNSEIKRLGLETL